MIADLRLALHLELLLGRIRRARSPLLHGLAIFKQVLWFAPLWVLVAAALDSGRIEALLLLVVGLTWTMAHASGTRAARMDGFDALRFPSRPHLVAARWMLHLPWLMACGASWATAAALHAPGRRPVLVLFACALPLLQAALSGWHRLQQRRGIAGGRAPASTLAAGLCVPASIAAFAFLPETRWPLAILVWLLAARLLVLQVRAARTGEADDPRSRNAEGASAQDRPSVRAFETRLPATHPGRAGPWGAFRADLVARLRLRRGLRGIPDVPRAAWAIARHVVLGPLIASYCVYLSVGAHPGPVPFVALIWLLYLPRWGAPRPDLRLWLFGADAREQYRAWLKGLLLPTVLTIAAGGGAVWMAGPNPLRWQLLAFLAAGLLLRAGLGGILNAIRGPWESRALAGVGVLALVGFVMFTEVTVPGRWVAIALLAAIGGLGILLTLTSSEERLLADMRTQ